MLPIILVRILWPHSYIKNQRISNENVAEEIKNAPTVIPLSMGISTTINGTLGFAMLVALLFAMPSDVQGTLNSTTQYPYMSIYTHAVGSTAGGTAMVRIDWLSLFLCDLGDD